MAEADSQIAACSPSFGCAGRVDTSFHVERYRSDVTRGGFYYAHPFSHKLASIDTTALSRNPTWVEVRSICVARRIVLGPKKRMTPDD